MHSQAVYRIIMEIQSCILELLLTIQKEETTYREQDLFFFVDFLLGLQAGVCVCVIRINLFIIKSCNLEIVTEMFKTKKIGYPAGI